MLFQKNWTNGTLLKCVDDMSAYTLFQPTFGNRPEQNIDHDCVIEQYTMHLRVVQYTHVHNHHHLFLLFVEYLVLT